MEKKIVGWLSGAEVLCSRGRWCSSSIAVLAAAESRTGQARLPACRVSWAKQAPSWRGVVGTPEEALTTTWHDSMESTCGARHGDPLGYKNYRWYDFDGVGSLPGI